MIQRLLPINERKTLLAQSPSLLQRHISLPPPGSLNKPIYTLSSSLVLGTVHLLITFFVCYSPGICPGIDIPLNSTTHNAPDWSYPPLTIHTVDHCLFQCSVTTHWRLHACTNQTASLKQPEELNPKSLLKRCRKQKHFTAVAPVLAFQPWKGIQTWTARVFSDAVPGYSRRSDQGCNVAKLFNTFRA